MNYAVASGMTAGAATSPWGSAHRPSQSVAARSGLQPDGNSGDIHDPGLYEANAEILLAHTHRVNLTLIETDGSLVPDVALV